MSVGEMLVYIWSLFEETGYYVFDTFVSFADIFIFIVIVGLLIWLVVALLGGD